MIMKIDANSIMLNNLLSKKLIYLRRTKNLTQGDLAEALNVDRSTYCCYEIGKAITPIWTLFKIAKFYDVSMNYLTYPEILPEEAYK